MQMLRVENFYMICKRAYRNPTAFSEPMEIPHILNFGLDHFVSEPRNYK